MSQAFARAAEYLDLKASLLTAAANDLLPPRDEDRVRGEVGKRFLESLNRSVSTGEYEPDRCQIVQVPKPGFTTRPAALLSLDDRVVYEALVAALRPRIDQFLVSSEAVFWPRGLVSPKRWDDFESAPASTRYSYVALVDIAGFYDSIPHRTLAALLLEATGRREIVEALLEFLDRCMGLDSGIPQGLPGSDPLATAYLTPLDRALLLAGFDYFRHGDDIRIAVPNFASGRSALSVAERELRQLGLMVNASKCQVIKRETYEANLVETIREKSQLRQRIEQMNIRALREGDEQMLLELAERLGIVPETLDLLGDDKEAMVTLLAEVRAGVGPYETLSFEESIELLREEIGPDDIAIAEELFAEALSHAPDQDEPWERGKFHAALWESLTSLAASDNPAAIEHCSRLLLAFPDETEIIVRYLSALNGTYPSEVVNQVRQVLNTEGFRYGWQTAWLYRVLASAPDHLEAETINAVRQTATNEDADWLERIEAIRLLATAGEIDRELLWRMWRRAPGPFRPDVVAAAAVMANSQVDWAVTFVDACRGNRVNEVVIAHILTE